MSGETNLAILLKNMRPYLNKGEYVFCCNFNVVAGFYHDHIFVEQPKAAQALAVLEEIGKVVMNLSYRIMNLKKR